MAYDVLVVDDSSFFRRRLKEILNQAPNLNVIGEARNGLEAIAKIKELNPDVVTMDVDMPVMDGITAVKKIMQSTPVPILMFSSLTREGAKATLDALDAGALDFISKSFEEIALNNQEINQLLRERVATLARKRSFVSGKRKAQSGGVFLRSSSLLNAPLSKSKSISKIDIAVGECKTSSGKSYKILAIGTSTGGPVALQKVLMQLPVTFPYPIILVQHMPGSFTKAFAERLNEQCKITVKEAQSGDKLIAGNAYLAPGGKQLTFEGTARSAFVKISESCATLPLSYKPSVDLTFSSICDIFGGDVLAIILTGMGSDGREGSRKLQQKGAKIWAQDELSSVVYGMPQAVTVAKIAERSLAINDVGRSILTEMRVN